MDGNTIRRIKDELMERRSQISSAKSLETQAQTHQGQQVEIIDIAQALEQYDRDASLAEQERRELNAIERALAKMATGTYGFCEDCSEEIAPKRLLAIPYARLCARCQTIEEKHRGKGKVVSIRGTNAA